MRTRPYETDGGDERELVHARTGSGDELIGNGIPIIEMMTQAR
ncbi:hypothetical protein [Bilophila wadsworthia]